MLWKMMEVAQICGISIIFILLDFPSCLKIGRITPIYKKAPRMMFLTIDQSLHFLYFEKFFKKYFTAVSIPFLLITKSFQVLNLDSENFTQPVTQLITP